MNHCTVCEIESGAFTLNLRGSFISGPIFKCSMPLEPHRNADFKTGAGLENPKKNVGVMAKKVKVLPAKIGQVFSEYYF